MKGITKNLSDIIGIFLAIFIGTVIISSVLKIDQNTAFLITLFIVFLYKMRR